MSWWSRPGRGAWRCGRAERRGRRTPRAARGGFTLVEVLAALVIVGFVAILAVGAASDGVRGQHGARRHLEAVALAEERLGELAALPTDSLLARDGARAGRFAEPFGRYAWRAQVRRASDAPALLEAEVVVTWDGGAYDLATRLHRPDAELGGVGR